jgi:broad specificity phosphatase PhoE
VSAIVRLTLLAHGMTEAMSAGRFPADEPLSDLGVRQVRSIDDLGPVDRVLTGPETRTRQTAELCGWTSETDPRLADLNYGCWQGEGLTGVDPAALQQWMTDPASTPHAGESLTALIARTADWLDSISRTPGRVVAVTHSAVIRAAILTTLHAPPESFWRIDITPASRTHLHYRRTWTLRMA